MKKSIITVLVALLATMGVNAQQIAVVSEGGTTTLFQTLDEAVTGASSGSVIYLPGGGFQIKDETKINKRLTIMGVSHRTDTDNADGGTTVSGNLFFEDGSDGSSVMGIYLSGNVYIGTTDDVVTNILIRYCNTNSVQITREDCSGILINQCYLRNPVNCGNNNTKITNCICHSIINVNAGVIDHNVVFAMFSPRSAWYYPLYNVNNATISNNILLNWGDGFSGSNCQVANNISPVTWGENYINTSDWNELFVGPVNGASIFSNYHLKSTTGQGAGSDGTDIGIYGGTGFSDAALAPIPRIISKSIPEQTDASGKLKIQVTVKAN